jgi:hypothetical protein
MADAYSAFSINENMPKISNDLFVESLEKKIREEVECSLIIRREEKGKLMAPSRLFEKISSSWRSVL